MSKRGLLLALVALVVSVSFAGCLGDDDPEVTPTDGGSETDDGGDASDDATDSEDDDGSTDTGGSGGPTGDEEVVGAPTAAFAIDLGNETNATTGLPVGFNASASSDPDGSNLTYAWDFGDNASADGVVVNHTFTTDGNYTVTLTVENDSGLTDSTSQVLAVVNGTITPGVLFTGDGTIVAPNPAIGLFGTGGQFVSLDDHQTMGGVENTHWQVHTVTGVPAGIESLRFLVEYTSPDGQIVMKLAIKVFPEDGSAAVDSSSFPSGRPDLTLQGDDLGETTYHVFVYSPTAPNTAYTLTVSYA